MAKSHMRRDYSLIHECWLTLSECYGHQYNNKFEDKSKKQIKIRKMINDIKQELKKFQTAVFYVS